MIREIRGSKEPQLRGGELYQYHEEGRDEESISKHTWGSKMIVDSHYHLEERIETVDRLLGQMDLHGIDRVALMPALNDPFTFGGFVEKFSGLGRWALKGGWRGLGMYLYRSMVAEDGRLVILNKSYPIYDEPDNESVARVMQVHPDRFYGWIVVNPKVANPIAEIERWVGRPNWVGVKIHPSLHRYPVAMAHDVAEYCSENGLPLMVHLGGDQERGDYRYLPERYPNLKTLYAHAGVPFWDELWEYAGKKDNVFVDLSSQILDNQLRLETVEALGAGKCLYGTDGPYGYPDTDGSYDHGRILKEILKWPLPEADKKRILGGNFKEMTGT